MPIQKAYQNFSGNVQNRTVAHRIPYCYYLPGTKFCHFGIPTILRVLILRFHEVELDVANSRNQRKKVNFEIHWLTKYGNVYTEVAPM